MKCGAKNKAGKPCGASALARPGAPRCVAHAGGKAAERQAEARREGGRQRMRQVDRPPVGDQVVARPRPGSKSEVDVEIWRLFCRVEAGELAARDGNLMLASLHALRDTLPDGPSADVQFFSLFVRVHVNDGGMVGETSNGLRIPFTPAQVDAYQRALNADVVDDPVNLVVRRGGRQEEPEVVFEIDAPPDAQDEAAEGAWRGGRALPEMVVHRNRSQKQDVVN